MQLITIFERYSDFADFRCARIIDAIFHEIRSTRELARGRSTGIDLRCIAFITDVKRAAFGQVKRHKTLRLSDFSSSHERLAVKITHSAPRHARCTMDRSLSS